MEKESPGWTLSELAEILGGVVSSNAHYVVRRPVPADSDDPEGIAFCESEAYLERSHTHGVGALLLPHNLWSSLKPVIHVEYPRVAFGKLLAICKRDLPLESGIHPTAIIHPEAYIADSASIGPYCVVERGAQIGEQAKIYPYVYVGENCQIGAKTTVFPNVVLYQDVQIGIGSVIHSGAILGADGFGFNWDGKRHVKVPQVGRVQIGDAAEIGANTTVDRATAGVTSVGDGTKIDNLVQVAHNVSIGRDGVIAALSGIGGSTQIGDRITMAGQCAIKDHVTIVDDVTLGGSTGVAGDILAKGPYFGRPALPAAEGLRAFMLVPKLPDLLTRIRNLEKQVKALEGDKE